TAIKHIVPKSLGLCRLLALKRSQRVSAFAPLLRVEWTDDFMSTRPNQNTVLIGVSEPRVLFLGGSPFAPLFLYDVIICVACGGRVNFADDEVVAWTFKPLQHINGYLVFGGLFRYLSSFHRF